MAIGVGVPNYGNTCFISVIIQLLRHINNFSHKLHHSVRNITLFTNNRIPNKNRASGLFSPAVLSDELSKVVDRIIFQHEDISEEGEVLQALHNIFKIMSDIEINPSLTESAQLKTSEEGKAKQLIELMKY